MAADLNESTGFVWRLSGPHKAVRVVRLHGPVFMATMHDLICAIVDCNGKLEIQARDGNLSITATVFGECVGLEVADASEPDKKQAEMIPTMLLMMINKAVENSCETAD
jgi:hypothetical protein